MNSGSTPAQWNNPKFGVSPSPSLGLGLSLPPTQLQSLAETTELLSTVG